MHHDTVLPFLEKEQADVVCIQELFEDDLPMYEKSLNMKGFFKPMCYFESFTKGDGKQHLLGPAIFTKYEVIKFDYKYIFGTEDSIPLFDKPVDSTKERNNTNILVIWVDISISGQIYRVATTHFTWTPKGLSTQYQKEDTLRLLEVLKNNTLDFILVGDFNMPRGGENFKMIADTYKDNIPLEYDTSIDPNLHRVKNLKRMVDGLFSTKEYEVKDVKFVEGISDHKAVVALVEKI